jgi:fused signal recognition particle receptor
MPRSWDDAFLGLSPGRAAPEAGAEGEASGRRGWFRRLRENLARSSRAMASQLQEIAFDPADAGVWERLEEALIFADVGVPATVAIVGQLEAEAASGTLSTPEELRAALVRIVADMLRRDGAEASIDVRARPAVLLVVGVNGTGKTTSIGKLAYRLSEAGASVVIGAADTFRAAAGEQLEVWAARSKADFVGSSHGGDPAAVAFDALSAAEARERDVVIVDTAGRLHTQDHLMQELAKVRRVIAGRLEGAPHETLLVVDATTGQNGLQQARLFSQAADVTGIVLTKLDGTAKGGIAIAIAHELGLPIKLIGVGEALEDLRPFDAEDFARALFEPSGDGHRP